MKIKKLVVDSLQEAVEEVRALYGSEAVILSTKVIKQRLIPFLPFPKRSKLEITVGIPDKEDFATELKKGREFIPRDKKAKRKPKGGYGPCKKAKSGKGGAKKG